MAAAKRSTFQLVLIKPTHYYYYGYPITWLRSHIPSNTLAALYMVAQHCWSARLEPDVDIVARPIDETNSRIRAYRIVADIKRSGGRALICLVGVQSNQFPRALSIWPAGSSRPAFRLRWAASTSRAVFRCCRSCCWRSRPPWTWASRCSRAKPRKAASTKCWAMPGTAP